MSILCIPANKINVSESTAQLMEMSSDYPARNGTDNLSFSMGEPGRNFSQDHFIHSFWCQFYECLCLL